MTQFANPATPSEGIVFDELIGSLLMVKVIYLEEHVPNVNSKPGEKSPAIRADVTVLDGPQAGKEYPDALIFPRVLQGQLRSRLGQLVLGRLTKGEAKPGKNAPWMLAAATPQDTQLAEQHLARRTTPQVTSVSSEPPF